MVVIVIVVVALVAVAADRDHDVVVLVLVLAVVVLDHPAAVARGAPLPVEFGMKLAAFLDDLVLLVPFPVIELSAMIADFVVPVVVVVFVPPIVPNLLAV